MAKAQILIFNCGSSSIKFTLFNKQSLKVMLNGFIEKISQTDSSFSFIFKKQRHCLKTPNLNYKDAFKLINKKVNELGFEDIQAIGHRVVHGGNFFSKATLIDTDVIKKIEQLTSLAPLHNSANLTGIEFCQQHFFGVPQIAMFDTAFHQSIPEAIHRYGVDDELYQQYHIRKYGFHGISHNYIAQQAAQYLKKEHGNFISAHLGNGCSIAAIKQGKSIDTSMGFTPLDGLIMGTRSGSIDPSIFTYINTQTDLTIDQITERLNKKSGLAGLCGSSDMRDICKRISSGDEKAQIALNIFCHRTARTITSYMMYFEDFDGLIFTAGIGENSPLVRQKVTEQLKAVGFLIDTCKNQNTNECIEIQTQSSHRIMVVPTNEELMIAQSCVDLM